MATERERIAIALMKKDIKNLGDSFKDFKDNDFKAVKDSIDKIEAAITDGITVNDKRYAAKWVQTLLTGMIAAILLVVLYAVLALVIIPGVKHTPQSVSSSSTVNPTVNETTPGNQTSGSSSQPGGAVNNLLKQTGL